MKKEDEKIEKENILKGTLLVKDMLEPAKEKNADELQQAFNDDFIVEDNVEATQTLPKQTDLKESQNKKLEGTYDEKFDDLDQFDDLDENESKVKPVVKEEPKVEPVPVVEAKVKEPAPIV